VPAGLLRRSTTPIYRSAFTSHINIIYIRVYRRGHYIIIIRCPFTPPATLSQSQRKLSSIHALMLWLDDASFIRKPSVPFFIFYNYLRQPTGIWSYFLTRYDIVHILGSLAIGRYPHTNRVDFKLDRSCQFFFILRK